VLAVDADNVQTCGARRYQAQTERHGTRKDTTDNTSATTEGQLIHATHLVTEKSLNELLTAIHHNGRESTETSKDRNHTKNTISVPWLLCGLHTCGDLGSSSLRLFTEGDARALVNVGCCYNLLTEEESNSITIKTNYDKSGFPLSHWLRSSMSSAKDGTLIGLTGRHLACQAPSRWLSQVDTVKTAFERNYYRALLQVSIQSLLSICFKVFILL
jgi:hypothetical protein